MFQALHQIVPLFARAYQVTDVIYWCLLNLQKRQLRINYLNSKKKPIVEAPI
jgi:hypothetical protein